MEADAVAALLGAKSDPVEPLQPTTGASTVAHPCTTAHTYNRSAMAHQLKYGHIVGDQQSLGVCLYNEQCICNMHPTIWATLLDL